jgi:mRNA interferase MazF
MLRGEVWWAALPKPVASEPGFRRPVVLVQSDAYTRSRIRTVLAVVVTSNPRLARAPGNVALPAKVSGLPRDSVVNVSRIVTLDKTFLVERSTRLPDELIQHIEDGLRLVLAL